MSGAARSTTQDVRAADFDRCVHLFEAEFDFIYRSLRRHGVAPADAEDVAQEAFLVMWRRWAEYDPRRPLRAWLSGIVFRVAWHHRGKAAREVPAGLIDALDEQPTPEDRVSEASARALVARVLEALPEREATLLRLYEIEGIPMRDIAQTLRIPLQTAYTRLRKGRTRFDSLLRRLVTVADARATTATALGTALLRAQSLPPAPSDRRRRAVARVRALSPHTLPPQAPPPARLGMPLWGALGAAAALAVLALVLVPRSPAPRPRSLASAPATRPVFTSGLPAAPDATPGPASLREGLLGYWRFDDGAGSTLARDLSGHGHDCFLQRLDPQRAWTNGPLGGALALDGGGWLECPHPQAFARLSSEITIALWVKRTGDEDHVRALVSRQRGTESRDHFHLGFRDDELWLRSMVRGNAAGLGPPVKIARGRWSHVAGTLSADGVARVYLDGQEINRKSGTDRPSMGGGTTPMIIGAAFNYADPTRVSERLRADLDELLLYERALTPAEIHALARGAQPSL